MNTASCIKAYFATLPLKNKEHNNLEAVVIRVSTEKPGYLRFLLGFFQHEKIAVTRDLKNLIIQKVESHLSLFERLPLEVKNLVFAFLGPQDLNRASQAFLDLRSILDRQKVIWANENKGDVLALDLPPTALESLLTRHGQQLHVLQFEGWRAQFLPSISLCQNLTTLITPDHNQTSLAKFIPLVGQLTTLKQLKITGMFDKKLNEFAVQASKLTNLQQLIIKDSSIHESNIGELPSGIFKLTNLQILQLSHFSMDVIGVQQLGISLEKLTRLIQLKLKSNRINKGIIHIGKPIRTLTQLQTLNLRGNFMDKEAMNRFAEPLGKLKNLTELDLSHNKINITKKTARQLGKLVHLRRFSLCHARMTTGGMINLVRQFGKLIFLEDLDLSANSLFETYPKGFHHLGKLTNLRSLNLEGTDIWRIESANMNKFARPFSKLTNLQRLDLSENGLGNNGIISLSPSLGKLLNLVTLDLSSNDFSNTGVKQLALAVGKLATLQMIDLFDCEFTTSGAKKLIPALSLLPNLKRADLRDNRINTKKTIHAICQLENSQHLLKIIEFNI